MSGVLALVGGDEFGDGCTFDAELLAASGGTDVLVLPTAAAYEHPDRAVETATSYFAGLGGTATGCMVLNRRDAFDQANLDAVAASRFTYLTGGSPMHLVSVLKETPLWDALVAAWHDGAVLAGSSAGAMVLCDPMVDPRGGAFTLGLGLVAQLALIPHHERWSEEKAKRTIDLARADLPIAGIDSQTALLRDPDGSWRTAGAGEVVVFVNGEKADLGALPT
jgi:cyanophycinase